MTIQDVKVPNLGNVASATIIEIAVKPGDEIQADATLITLESDKASMDIPSPFAGRVKEVKVKLNDKIAADDLILTMEVEEKSASKAPPSASETASSATTDVAVTLTPAPHPVPESVHQKEASQNELYAGPGVRRLAHELNIDLTKIKGTGLKGRISKDDLHHFIKAQMSSGTEGGVVGSALPMAPVVDFTAFGSTENLPLSRIKRLTAAHLHRNWLLVPHVTQFDEADITELEAFRKAQQTPVNQGGAKLTLLAFILKALVQTLKAFPTFNASLSPDHASLIIKKYFHIGVAVDTPSGLVVPVIRDVDKKGLLDLAKELKEVSAKARAEQLTPADIQGNSFTVSSLGGVGGTAFTPIVNLPDVAILGVSKALLKPVFVRDAFVPRLMLPLSLSYDHRVIDGAEAARFTTYLSQLLGDMRRCLL